MFMTRRTDALTESPCTVFKSSHFCASLFRPSLVLSGAREMLHNSDTTSETENINRRICSEELLFLTKFPHLRYILHTSYTHLTRIAIRTLLPHLQCPSS